MQRLFESRHFVPILLLILLTVAPLNSYAQENEYKKFSITLSSGVTYGSTGDGVIGRLAGNFNVPSFRKQIYGGGIQFAVSPAFSIDTGIQFGQFTNQYDFDPAFENDFFYATVKGITNMNGLFNVNSRLLNPYISFGLGMIHSRIQTVDLDSDDLSLLSTVGAGMNFYLFPGADFFVQYDYNAAGSDLLDGFSGQGSSDQFAVISAGLRINFGPSGSKLVSWPPPRDTRFEISTSTEMSVAEDQDLEVEEEVIREEVPEPENLQVKEEREQQLQRMVDEAFRDMLQKKEQNRKFADEWRAEQRQKQLEAEAEAAAEAERSRLITDQPEPGHYIQVFSFSNLETAEEMRAMLDEELNDRLESSGGRVIIHQFDGLHRVLIGAYQNYRTANSMLQNLDSDYGAFIITYPRPE
jgi:hypothetical protein